MITNNGLYGNYFNNSINCFICWLIKRKQIQFGKIQLSSINMELPSPFFYFLSYPRRVGIGLGSYFHYAAHKDVVAGEGADVRIVAGLIGGDEFDGSFFSVVD